MVKKRKAFWKTLLKFGILLILILASLDLILLFYSGFFDIKNIDIHSSNTDCLTGVPIKDELGLIGKNILFVNPISFEKVIRQKYTCIRSAKLSKKLPQTILIDLSGKEAQISLIPLESEEASPSSALIATASAGFLVDKDGIIFAEDKKNSDIPKLYLFNQSLKVGDQTKADIFKRTLLVLQGLKKSGLFVSVAILYPNNILEIDTAAKILIDLSSEFEKKLVSLQLIIAQAKIEEKDLELIDLRFENPVVKYAKR